MSRDQDKWRARNILLRLLRPAWQAEGLQWGESEDEDVDTLLDLLFHPSPSSSFAAPNFHTEEEDEDALEAVLDKLLDSDEGDGLPSPSDIDLSDDGDALASAGWGTDEDYSGNDRDDF